ncbi:hypothetical protein LZ518_02055 [Sphingomonas sp. RB56-2]|uniref:Glycerophosphoryl diester phosphodiesterase membrane domain-containing protein n=1 Tax=Sphingomonas brevis TaxID=2908206 RepID=A0ABT0S6B3_9SPHN|nr:hypothetical protein [Sphingomonas brevis]MCL6739921.1 hypothetical protein [Sphingomonas brevis]
MSHLSIGKAWDEAKAALSAHRRLIVPIALGLILLPAVIASMVEPQVPPGQQPPPGSWMLVVLAMIFVMFVGQLAMVLLVNGWRGSVGEAIGQAARRAPPLILAAMMFGAVVILLFSAILAIGMGPAIESGQFDVDNTSGLGWILLLLGLVAFLYFTIRLLMLIPVIASEQVGPIAALRRAFVLTAGNFWRLFGFVAMLVLGFMIVALTVGAVVGAFVTLLFGRPEPWTIALLLVALAGGLVQAGFMMVYTAMLARIYAQLSAGQASVPEVKRED